MCMAMPFSHLSLARDKVNSLLLAGTKLSEIETKSPTIGEFGFFVHSIPQLAHRVQRDSNKFTAVPSLT